MLEKVIEIIKEQLNLEGVEVTEDSSFKDDLGADSLDLFELVMAVEEEYGVEIPAEELEKLTTVGSVVEYLKERASRDNENGINGIDWNQISGDPGRNGLGRRISSRGRRI